MSIERVNKYDAVDTLNVKQANWRCGIYLRLSREDGDRIESDSITNQRKVIDRFLEKNLELNVYDIYVDDGYTGTSFNRPEVTRLINDIKSGKVNCLIVKDLSRFGRDHIETGRYLEIVFPILKLRVISVTENIDSYKNPASMKNAVVSLKTVMNDEYCRDISDKVRSVFDMKRRRGDFIGSFASYGYMKDPENRHKLIIDQDAAQNVKQIYEWFLDGVSTYNICRMLYKMRIPNPTEYRRKKGLKILNKSLASTDGAWSRRTVQRILQNRLYTGDLTQKQYEKVSHKVKLLRQVPKERQITKKNSHDPIIDIETFEKAQALFSRNRWQSRTEELNEALSANLFKDNIFRGYVKCTDCGRSMTRSRVETSNRKVYYYFSCTSYRKWRKCTKHTIRIDLLEQTILTIIQKHIEIAIEMGSLIEAINNSPVRNNALARISKNIKTNESERIKLTKLLNDLYPDFKSGLITKEQYLYFKIENESKISEIDTALKKLNEQYVKEEQGFDSSIDYIANFKKYKNINTLTREVINELIKMIYIEENGGIKIEFNFQDIFEQVADYIEANKVFIENDSAKRISKQK